MKAFSGRVGVRVVALALTLASGVVCISSTGTKNNLGRAPQPSPPLTNLFTELDARLPKGYYRGPSLVTTPSGTLLAFVLGALHRHDGSPTIIYLRRSVDNGSTWLPATPILLDPTNRTHFTGAALVDVKGGAVHYLFQTDVYTADPVTGPRGPAACPGCIQRIITSHDDGANWTKPAVLPLTKGQLPNATWGKALASGIALVRGAHAGRLMYALRHDCGCGDKESSFVVYSDDHGKTWAGGAKLILLPQDGGGWTECQVAELHNGSVLLTSRNSYGLSSGMGPRLFARSDDGGVSWAANWSAGADLPDPYCEASIVSHGVDGNASDLYLTNPSNPRSRGNLSAHRSSGTNPPFTCFYYL